MRPSRFFYFLVLIFVFNNAFSSSGIRYNPDQLTVLEKTHTCENCDLTGATISGNYSNIDVKNSDLTGSHLENSTFSYGNFSGSKLNSVQMCASIFSGSNLENAQLIQSNLIGSDFSNANLSGAVFTSACLNHANFYGSNISTEQLSMAASYCYAILPNGVESDSPCNGC